MAAAQAALAHERGGSVALESVHIRPPRSGDILVRIMASGVCPTDLYALDGGVGEVFPAVFGHEGAGIVEQIGEGVTRVAVGDRVVLSYGSCGTCAACLAGHTAGCRSFGELNYRGSHDDITLGNGHAARGAFMAQSSWATHVVTGERSAVKIGDDVPWEIAAPLGCGILTGAGTVFNVLAPTADDAVLVVGAGTTGLAAVMAASHRGVRRIVVSDPVAERRRLAEQVGATETITPGEPVSGITRALDTVGVQTSIDAALGSLVPGGMASTVALKAGSNAVSISQSRLLWGRSLRGVIEGDADIDRDIPRLLALWRAGRLPLERLVRSYPFERISDAIADARSGAAVKAVLRMDIETDTRAVAPVTPPPMGVLDALLSGAVTQNDYAGLWRSLPPASASDLHGLWRGHGLTHDHYVQRLLERSNWFGKLFASDEDVAPIVVRTADGTLAEDRDAARGGASIRMMSHDGLVTACMVYDAMPVIDAFVRIDANTLLGVMTGKNVADRGELYYFVLERDVPRDVHRAADHP